MTIEQRAREILSKIDESDFMAVLDRHREHPEKIIAEALRAERKAALESVVTHIPDLVDPCCRIFDDLDWDDRSPQGPIEHQILKRVADWLRARAREEEA
jgi:hypothetical protein